MLSKGPPATNRTLQASIYYDKALGSWIGQMIGNILGLPTEGRFNEVPNPEYVTYYSEMPEGSFTDDDTSMEWVFLHMLEEHGLEITYSEVREEWMEHINEAIWVANARARELMDEGYVPPETGSKEHNEHWGAIDAQIECELFGVIHPGMGDKAYDMAKWFARVTNDDYAVEAAGFYATMFSYAFFESDVSALVEMALTKIPKTSLAWEVVSDVIKWHKEYLDWKETRRLIWKKYGRYGWVSSPLNLASVVMALLYGNGDFDLSLIIACAAGWDNDCNAATTGGLLGSIVGESGIHEKWKKPLMNFYRNTNRDNLPPSETISSIALRTQIIAEKAILAHGGLIIENATEKIYVIQTDLPWVKQPSNSPSDENLARRRSSAPICYERPFTPNSLEKLGILNDGIISNQGLKSENVRGEDWWGYTFGDTLKFNQVICYQSEISEGDRWETLAVQYRDKMGRWRNVTGLEIIPLYDFWDEESQIPFVRFTLNFNTVNGTGIRIFARDGFDSTRGYTSITEIEVFYRGSDGVTPPSPPAELRMSQINIITYTNGQAPIKTTFAVVMDENYVHYVETDSTGIAKIILSGEHGVKILGPVLTQTSKIFVPMIIDLGKLQPGSNVSLPINLTSGAMIRILNVPPVESNAVVDLLLEVKNLTFWNSNWINIYGGLSPFSPYILNMTGDMVIVPSNKPLKIEAKSALIDSVIIDEHGDAFILKENQVRYVDTLALHMLVRNQEIAQKNYNEAIDRVQKAEEYGLYIELEKERLIYANRTIENALTAINNQEIFQAAYYLKEAYDTSIDIQNEVDRLLDESTVSFPLTIVLLFTVGIAVASLCFEEKSKQMTFSTIFFVIFYIFLHYSYPGFKFAGINEYVTAGYIVIIVFLAYFLLTEFFKDVKSVGGVALISAIIMSLSLALRNMKRRRIRTLLIFTSLIIMVFGFTWLTSISLTFSTKEMKVTSMIPPRVNNLVVASRIDTPLSYRDITWIAAQPEARAISLKAQSVPQKGPLGYIGSTFQINGIIGIMAMDPNLETLSLAVTPEGLDGVLHTYASALVSREVAVTVGLELGDEITVSGRKIKVSGFFDSAKIGRFRDVDDDFWCPKKITPRGEIVECPGNELIITNFETAINLGAVIARSYIYTANSQSAINVAKRISLLSSYFVVVFPGGNMKYIYFPSTVMSVGGSAIVVPLALLALNIGGVMVASIHERKKEILTLSIIGVNPSHVTYIFISEALFLGFVSGGIGHTLGILTFKILDIFNLHIPTNMKTSSSDIVATIGITLFITFISYLVPSLKASALVTPSLLRRWKLEVTPFEGVWSQDIPARITPTRVQAFVNYLFERLREEHDGLVVKISNMKKDVHFEERAPFYTVSFRYLRGEDRPFYADTKLTIKRRANYYGILMSCKPYSVYPKFEDRNVHEVTSFIRRIVLEWASFRNKIIIPLGKSYDIIIDIIKTYDPQLLYIISRKPLKKTIKGLEDDLRLQGLLMPNIKVRMIKGKSIQTIVDMISGMVNEVDLVCADSDDGLLSAALTLAGLRMNKRFCYFVEGKFVEERLEK